MPDVNFIVVPRQITVGTSFSTYETISNEASYNYKYHGANTTGGGESNLNSANGKISHKFVTTDRNMNCVLYDGYSDEHSSSIAINNRRGERVSYFGEEYTPGSYERRMTIIDVTYMKPDGTFGHQRAEDKNNNGTVDEGEIIDFKW